MCSDIELSNCSRESILAPLSFPAWLCPDGWEAFLAANLSCPVFPYTVSMGEGCRRPTDFMEGVYFLHTRCSPLAWSLECFKKATFQENT